VCRTDARKTAVVRLKLEVIRGKKIPWMRIEKADSLGVVNANKPLEIAVETATVILDLPGQEEGDSTAWRRCCWCWRGVHVLRVGRESPPDVRDEVDFLGEAGHPRRVCDDVFAGRPSCAHAGFDG
jgi:hypothetical protein